MRLNLLVFIARRAAFLKRLVRGWAAEPETLRRAVRESQPGQIVLCVGLGLGVGLLTLFLHQAVIFGRELAFGLDHGERLSSAGPIDRTRLLAVPVVGGLVLGLAVLLMKRWRSREIVDPIEANAIHGGRMSVIDSLRVVIQTLISNIAGASIGMEAAYTQLGSACGSWAGRHLQLRRDDMRKFVAAGSAAAIAVAFNAPMAGAFYAFELVLGTYTIAALPQIAVCALSAALFLRGVTEGEPLFSLPLDIDTIPAWNFPLFVAVGIGAAQVGILTMKAVTKCEHVASSLPLPVWLRPALGGLLVALIALFLPAVLGSGQGAINVRLVESATLPFLLMLLGGKIAASALSLGMGFRGGLFSASLLIGCLFGQVCGIIASHILPVQPGQMESFMLVGMGAVGASIVGAPVTMVLLVLEMTGNYPATTGVMVGVLVSSVVTRYSFGYSFSTWRFHLRGLRITGAHDVGWIREVTVGSLMQPGPTGIEATATIGAVRALMPPGSARRVCLVDANGRYQGVVDLADIHNRDLDSKADTMAVGELAEGAHFYLLPQQNIRDALDLFAQSEVEELPVLLSPSDGRIIGAVTEPYVLKRYARELEARNLAQSGAGAPVET